MLWGDSIAACAAMYILGGRRFRLHSAPSLYCGYGIPGGLGTGGVGIYMELDHYDYPVSAPFWEVAGDMLRMGYIGVNNVSAGLRGGEWAPEYVISTKGAADVLEWQRYILDQQFESVTMLARADAVRE